MRKLLTISILIVLLVGVVGVADAAYSDELGIIVQKVAEDMTEMQNDTGDVSEGNMDVSTFLDKLERNRKRTLNNLIDIIDLASKAPDKRFHAKTTTLISDWLLIIDLVDEGLRNNDSSKIDAGLIIMGKLKDKADELTRDINNQNF